QRPFVSSDKRRQVRTVDFLFTFDYTLHVHGQGSLCPKISFQRLDVREQLSFAVTRAPAVEILAADRRLERWRVPFVERISRQDVVMTINQHGGPVWRSFPSAVDERLT